MRCSGIRCLIAGLALALPAAMPAHAARILIAGDSTAAHYAPDQYPQMGWGMFLPCALQSGTEVLNLARGGRSTRTFREEGLWSALVGQLQAGDTVLIQFGHNDEDTTKPWRHTEPDIEFRANLGIFLKDVSARGAQPVLLTPIARLEYEGNGIKDTHGAYAAAIRDVAAATKTPLIDLNAATMAFLDRQGRAAARGYFMIYDAKDGIARFPEGRFDTTHLNERGARAVAALAAQALADLKLEISGQVRAVSPDTVQALGNSACE